MEQEKIEKLVRELLPHYKTIYHSSQIILDNAKAIKNLQLKESDLEDISSLIQHKNVDAIEIGYIIPGIEALIKEYLAMMKDCNINI